MIGKRLLLTLLVALLCGCSVAQPVTQEPGGTQQPPVTQRQPPVTQQPSPPHSPSPTGLAADLQRLWGLQGDERRRLLAELEPRFRTYLQTEGSWKAEPLPYTIRYIADQSVQVVEMQGNFEGTMRTNWLYLQWRGPDGTLQLQSLGEQAATIVEVGYLSSPSGPTLALVTSHFPFPSPRSVTLMRVSSGQWTEIAGVGRGVPAQVGTVKTAVTDREIAVPQKGDGAGWLHLVENGSNLQICTLKRDQCQVLRWTGEGYEP